MRSIRVVNVCQEGMLEKCDVGEVGDSVVGVWSEEVVSWDMNIRSEEISKCLGPSKCVILLARKQYTV